MMNGGFESAESQKEWSTMEKDRLGQVKFSIVIPCYNEQRTLRGLVKRVLETAEDWFSLELIIVDDCSKDGSLEVARSLEREHPEVRVLRHERNQGKGAALRTGFQKATGDFVAVQDADLEYNPMELKKLLVPLINNEADVVFGSRFLSPGAHRVLYFWHSLGNKFLTFVSNMFSDLNLTDMETCYKVFRRDVIQGIRIEEDRFGFEPEIVAKVAHMRVRVYEMGISYYGRTYEEGKKIGAKDGLRALYCIFRYNAHRAPLPIQFLIYLIIGGISAIFNLGVFLGMLSLGTHISISAPVAFVLAAILNYILCILLLFRHKARWNSASEFIIYWIIVGAICFIDLGITKSLVFLGTSPGLSKMGASVIGLVFNFVGRRFMVFPETPSGAWKPQAVGIDEK